MPPNPSHFSLLINDKVGKSVPLPITKEPSTLSRENNEKAIKLQLLFNLLTHSLSGNWNHLDRIISPIKDSFTKSLYDRWISIRNQIPKDKILSYILRSDYMVDRQNHSLCQVELNTISVAFPFLSQQIHSYHRETSSSSSITENPLCLELCLSFSKLVTLFNSTNNFDSSITLMVISDGERNIYDQEGIINCLRDLHNIRMKRSSLKDSNIYFKENIPFIGEEPISLIYYRSCYSPETSNIEDDSLRGRLEISPTISIPSMSTHLCGLKIVQEKLVTKVELVDELLSPFIGDEIERKEATELIKSSFMDMHSGNWTPPDDWSNYVLKPQREGGGNNIFSMDIPKHLEKINRDEYTIQRLIVPVIENNILIPSVGPEINTNCSSEFGFFGSLIVADGNIVVENRCIGTLVRCKAETENEIGISSGFGYLSSLSIEE